MGREFLPNDQARTMKRTFDTARPRFRKNDLNNNTLNKAIVQGHTLPDESARHTDVRDDRHQRR
jgi:hypothetical protein